MALLGLVVSGVPTLLGGFLFRMFI